MEKFLCCNSIRGHEIATKFCTNHDMTVVLSTGKKFALNIFSNFDDNKIKFPSNLKCDVKITSDVGFISNVVPFIGHWAFQ